MVEKLLQEVIASVLLAECSICSSQKIGLRYVLEACE